VGVPVDTPVALTYFEGNELIAVQPNYPDYEHLINHVGVQLGAYEYQLYRTPVTLTLQGDLEEEEEEEEEEGEEDDDRDLDFGEDVTVDDLISSGIISDEEDDIDDDDDEDADEDEEGDIDDDEDEGDEEYDDDIVGDMLEGDDEDEEDEEEGGEEGGGNKNMASFWSSSPAGKLPTEYSNAPDVSIMRPANPDLSDLPADAFVTEEDTRSLRRSHKRADRIISYASDVSLIASFHYKKKNFHLVRLKEQIFIIGKRIADIKGYYFSLLDDAESAGVRPVLEDLLINRPKVARVEGEEGRRKRGGGEGVGGEASPTSNTPRKSRRRWIDRKRNETPE
jgi:hypothetical protein